MTVHEAIADGLVVEDCKDYFGLLGDGNMWLRASLVKNAGVNIISARHEAAAVSSDLQPHGTGHSTRSAFGDDGRVGAAAHTGY